MLRRLAGLLAVLLALVVGLSPIAAQDATPEGGSLLAGLGYPDLLVTTDGTDFTVPAEVEAGRYRVVLRNDSELGTELNLAQVPEGMTAADVQAAFEEADEAEVPPPLIYELVINGGAAAEPGATGEVVLDLAPGDWVFNLVGFSEEEDEEAEGIDLYTSVTVTGEPPAVEDPPVAAEVAMVDFDFEVPDGLAAGPQVWTVTNDGSQPHHLVLATIPDGTTEEQVLELINAFFGPPATPEAGATPVEPALGFDDYVEVGFTGILSAGQTNWLAFDLAPGTYVALCFIPDQDTGMPHVLMGMLEVFTVA